VTVTNVPLLDLQRIDASLQAELHEAFGRVLASGHYILGPEVDAFERECADYVGARHALGVSSGTDALLLALMALGVGAGDEVICPTFTFFATAGTVWRTGARPVFVDSSLADFNCLAEQIAAKVGPRTKAIIPVHLYGQTADMPEVMRAANGVPVIEDAAQALGARGAADRGAGTVGAFGCFSFFPSKNLGGFGDSGLVTTNDDALAERARVLRAHGGKPKYYHRVVGGNFRIDALQAALLRPKLRRLDAWTERRRANAAAYSRMFSETGIAAENTGQRGSGLPAILLPTASQQRHIFNQYCIRVPGAPRRDQLRAFLSEHGIGTEIYYPVPMHLQECFSSLGHQKGDFPLAETAAEETLALPIFPELTSDEIAFVVERVVAFFARR
jgi:dTDP-4-amino-4,6-dideoxygalactose transaminase